MSKIDCSRVLNYVAERRRMCDTYIAPCNGCPLYVLDDCSQLGLITQKHIDAVQKWSDEHPQQTMAEHFLKMFPNAKIGDDGVPVICPQFIGWGNQDKCPKPYGKVESCTECWNRPYSEVTK